MDRQGAREPTVEGRHVTTSTKHRSNTRKPPERLQRAISIRQPFVEQILTGIKKREFRSRPTRIRERVYLYAAKKLVDGARATPELGDLPKGMIVGSVEIAACLSVGGHFAYVLKKVRRYRSPVRAFGQPQPGFWHPRFKF